MAQGKAWDKEKVTEILKPYFKLGCSVTKACNYAGIPQQTVDTWIQKDNELRLRITAWQNELSATSRRNVARKIEAKSESTSWKWLERKEKEEFSPRQEVGVDGEVAFTIKDFYDAVIERDTTDEEASERQGTAEDTELRATSTAEEGGGQSGEVQDTGSGEAVREESTGSLSSRTDVGSTRDEDMGSSTDQRPNGEDLEGDTRVEHEGVRSDSEPEVDSEGELENNNEDGVDGGMQERG